MPSNAPTGDALQAVCRELRGRFVTSVRHLRRRPHVVGRGRNPTPRPGPIVQPIELSSRAKTHFALDPVSTNFAGEEPFWSLRRGRELDELKASPVTEVHIIVTKSGNLKVLQSTTALLRPHCDPATTHHNIMGTPPHGHKRLRGPACQHPKYARVSNESEGVRASRKAPRATQPSPLHHTSRSPVR